MRIAITGFGHESSMFSKDVADSDAFMVYRGEELLGRYDLAGRLGERAAEIEWIPTVNAQAAAGGPIVPAAFDAIVDEIVRRLGDAGAIDGLYIDLHGAAHVDGRDHAEEHLLRAIREVIGDDVVISVSMDPHGNFSAELAELVDLATCHRHSPHIDNHETRLRAIANLVSVLDEGRKPLKAWVRVPILLPGERTSSTVEPGASVYGAAASAADRDGVLDTGVWVGFAWADEDRNGAAVLVTGYEEEAVVACARELAERYWRAREEFDIVIEHSGTWSQALDFVAAGAPRQLWITDSGDNVTAGGSGDITYALTETLARPELLEDRLFLFAGIVDRGAVLSAAAAGAGAALDRAIGAVVDDRFAPAVPGPWTVLEVFEGEFGEGPVAALLDNGLVHVAVHGWRIKFTSPDDATLHPRVGQVWHELNGYDVVVAKNGYLFPGQDALASSSFMALTPGGTSLDFDSLRFESVDRPIYPLDTQFDPELAVVLVPTPSESRNSR